MECFVCVHFCFVQTRNNRIIEARELILEFFFAHLDRSTRQEVVACDGLGEGNHRTDGGFI